ncbi:hypothetical protein STAS_19664 [Striga asiatica]|uniref:Uncharacterized protein n=1 Tax=Striga asiatica TaxID=4170 RepID=A0A5A7QCX6_STRAF|nr:hypothetical protein STAS_19664 [Striga asiatica]
MKGSPIGVGHDGGSGRSFVRAIERTCSSRRAAAVDDRRLAAGGGQFPIKSPVVIPIDSPEEVAAQLQFLGKVNLHPNRLYIIVPNPIQTGHRVRRHSLAIINLSRISQIHDLPVRHRSLIPHPHPNGRRPNPCLVFRLELPRPPVHRQTHHKLLRLHSRLHPRLDPVARAQVPPGRVVKLRVGARDVRFPRRPRHVRRVIHGGSDEEPLPGRPLLGLALDGTAPLPEQAPEVVHVGWGSGELVVEVHPAEAVVPCQRYGRVDEGFAGGVGRGHAGEQGGVRAPAADGEEWGRRGVFGVEVAEGGGLLGRDVVEGEGEVVGDEEGVEDVGVMGGVDFVRAHVAGPGRVVAAFD